MTITIVIPVKPFATAKTRLAPVMTAHERAALARSCFEHVLAVARAAQGDLRIEVHSTCPDVLELAGAHGVRERGDGLNGVLEAARQRSRERGDAGMIALFADLPLLSPRDVGHLAEATLRHDLALAPDRAGSGTNALGLAADVAMPFLFGPGSRTAFAAEAARRGLGITTIETPGLSADVDAPADLALLRNAPVQPFQNDRSDAIRPSSSCL